MALSYKLLGILFLLFVAVKLSESGKTKKIKIHVPYYVKHIHHYKKVYVPKVQVIKHEHHHKKEHDHHHHHHDHGHEHGHDHYHSYDKSGHGYADESSHYDTYYDEIDSRNYGGNKFLARKGKFSYRENPQYQGWKDVDGSDYRGSESTEEEEEEDYSDVIEYPSSKSISGAKRPNLIIPIYRKKVRSNRRADDISHEAIVDITR